MSNETTKEKVLQAAIALFNVQGYHGTSVRHIAEKAKVNVALVSYYFGGKQGLLEQLVVQFLEGYLLVMERCLNQPYERTTRDTLLAMMEELLKYEQSNHHLARFVWREMTLDSILVREVMSTYLRKEKHYYEVMLQKGKKEREFSKQPVDFVIMQLRGMITMPFLHPHYLRELYQLSLTDHAFIKRYMNYVRRWVDSCLCQMPHPKSVVLNR
ncbi:forespore capture DNA-binding protein RefZ [Halalkalibacterium ligniniphilum]|uniref:forespore capture DNA-binding protein RefZ n=1 Tax=Halalkalibacterium ligniniphilum TaxID=1134413 RepID=UPI000346F6EB|nr:forespore capture DNA-binding protein RefZ [Halalkalibacterium ligniniphilum]